METNLSINESLKDAVNIAKKIAKENSNAEFSSSHLLLALMHKSIGFTAFLRELGKDVNYIKEWAQIRIDELPKSGKVSEEINGDDKVRNAFDEADNYRLKFGLLESNPVCVFLGLIRPNIGFDVNELKSFPVIEKEVLDIYFNNQEVATSISGDSTGQSAPTTTKKSKASLLKYCNDKTADAKAQLNDPVVGRDKEVRQMIEILCRRSKPNVILIGEPGVGKSALVESFSYVVSTEDVPVALKNANVYELDSGTLLAGASYKGEIEDRVKGILKDVKSEEKAILFIDEIHAILDPKGPFGAGLANLLKPELARGEITIIGATTTDEYRKLIEPERAFSRRFELVQVEEPTVSTAIKMLDAVVPKYSEHHGLSLTDDVTTSCVTLAKRYSKERRLPDSAIDLLDRTMSSIKTLKELTEVKLVEFVSELENVTSSEESDESKLNTFAWIHKQIQDTISPILIGSVEDEIDWDSGFSPEQINSVLNDYIGSLRSKFEQRKESTEIDSEDVATLIASSTGIPIGKIQSDEQAKLMNIENIVRQRVVGQDHAIKSLADAIIESRSGLTKKGKPIGSFFFLGPTGTGKTEVAKGIADFLFNDEKAMIRFDMSEFKEEHSAALLYGAPPGYVGYEEGGVLVNKIRETPYAVVLFDEIEKAHPSVFDIFLQILDEGVMHDRLGKEGDFSNSIILFTSNIASDWIVEQFSEGVKPKSNDLLEKMAPYFRPEFLARLTEIIPFAPIAKENVLKILDIHSKDLFKTLDKLGIAITISDQAKEILVEKGYTPKYGARPIVGVIRNYLRRPISKLIVSGELKSGHTVEVDVSDTNELTYNIK